MWGSHSEHLGNWREGLQLAKGGNAAKCAKHSMVCPEIFFA